MYLEDRVIQLESEVKMLRKSLDNFSKSSFYLVAVGNNTNTEPKVAETVASNSDTRQNPKNKKNTKLNFNRYSPEWAEAVEKSRDIFFKDYSENNKKTGRCLVWVGRKMSVEGLSTEGRKTYGFMPVTSVVEGLKVSKANVKLILHYLETGQVLEKSQRLVNTCGNKMCTRLSHLKVDTLSNIMKNVCNKRWG